MIAAKQLRVEGDVGQYIESTIALIQQKSADVIPLESKLQADFYAYTRIKCPRPVREDLEYLMQRHNFTSRELAIAWRGKALRSNNQTQMLVAGMSIIEIVCAWTAFVAISLLLAIWVSPYLLTPYGHLHALFIVSGVYGTIALAIARWVIYPHHIALRVVNTLLLHKLSKEMS